MKKIPVKNPAIPAESEDATLFRAAVGEVEPIPNQNRTLANPPQRKPLLRHQAYPPSMPDVLSDFISGETPDEFLTSGLSRMMLRKLRRGSWPIEDSLDLHGLNTESARKLLQVFLHGAVQHGFHCVLVIHGKGLNSRGGEAILRKHTRHWLTQYQGVLGFCDAPQKQGGSGAVLVLLKTSR